MLGPAGSGKSTQAEMICKTFGFKHIVESDLLKKIASKNNKEGKTIKKIMADGKLVPFEISSNILFKHIEKEKHQKLLIDGFPRDTDQTAALDYFIYSKNIELMSVVFISLSKQEVIKRLIKRDRADDLPRVIKRRYSIYLERTRPVIRRYKEDQKLIEINGNKPIEEVFKEISQKLKHKLC